MNCRSARVSTPPRSSPTRWHFARRQPAVGRTATTLLVAAALAHTFVIGMQTMEAGHVPVAGADVGHLDVRLAAGPRLPLHGDDDRRARDGRVHPAAAGRAAGHSGVQARASRSAPTVLQGPLFGLHVSSLLFAYASFALACVIGITYVLLFKEIKAKHLGFFYARLPSLQVLDSMNQRAIVDRLDLSDRRAWSSAPSGRRRCAATRPAIRGCRPCRCRTRRSSSRSSAGRSTRSSCSRRAASAGAGGGRRICRRSGFAIVLLNFVPISYFLTNEPQLLGSSSSTCTFCSSESVTAPRRSSCASGSTSRRAALDDRAARARRRAASTREAVVLSTCNRAEVYVACDDVDGDARRPRAGSSSEFHGVERAALDAARLRARSTSTRRATCSGWPPASTRSSSASRRFSAR